MVKVWDKERWPNFSEQEFVCKCGCGVNGMQAPFLDKLQTLRTAYGKPMPISSGYRCSKHNQVVSSTGPNGPHTTGLAADIAVDRADAHHLLECALVLGFKGIGVQQKGTGRFIHVDTISDSGRPTVWSY